MAVEWERYHEVLQNGGLQNYELCTATKEKKKIVIWKRCMSFSLVGYEQNSSQIIYQQRINV